jgi:AraC-like DNA-binding protein
MAALSTLESHADRAVRNAGADFTPLRAIHIGRLELDVIGANQPFKRNWERVDSVGDASYVLAFPLNGSLAFSQDGRIGIVAPGEYVLLSELAFYELSSDGVARLLMMRIPASELRRRVVSVEDHVSRRFKADEHMTRLLIGLITSIADLFVDRPPPNPQALATEIVSFVALTIGAEDRGALSDVRNARYHLRRRIFDFIEKHLSDQNLSPKKIAASSRISLSYLYSLFNDDDTTVGQFVQVKRLQRAYEILVGDPKGHRTVSEIAYEVGFKNVSHFSRTFSRHFKIPPRDVRKLSRDSFAEIAPAASRSKPAAAPKPAAPCERFSLPRWETNRRRALQETV